MARVKQYEITLEVRAEATVKIRGLSPTDAQNIAKGKLRKKLIVVSPAEEELNYIRITKCEEIK